jgi:glycerate-2-kinase
VSGRDPLVAVFGAALESVRAAPAVQRSLGGGALPEGPVHVLAVGKASVSMAEGAAAVLGARIVTGVIATKEGHGREVPGYAVHEAAHPVPDERSVACAEEALQIAGALGEADTLLVLLSGGASALWTAPVPGLTLEDKCRLTEQLLGSGIDIVAFNAVRKHLSRIKGGGLARAAYPARVLTLLVSDVRGDAVDVVGSGPTAPDLSTYSTALAALDGLDLRERVPSAAREFLSRGEAGAHAETPKPGDPIFERVEHRIVANLDDALRGACKAAEGSGLRVRNLGACLYGEAREEAKRLADRARTAANEGVNLLVAGGEPTVRLRGKGRGGRAQEMALAFACEIEGAEICGLFAGTDGTDGPTDAAGAIVDGETLARARRAGMDPLAHLERNDAYPLLDATGDLFRTGPTDTNVTDLALIRLRR